MSEEREKALAERAENLRRWLDDDMPPCSNHDHPGHCEFCPVCRDKAILATLKETAEEIRAESEAWYSQAMDHLNAMHGRAVKCEQDCWVCAAVFAARAEGERAEREAERERAARIADVYSVHAIIDACPDYWVARQIASAIRYRGSE